MDKRKSQHPVSLQQRIKTGLLGAETVEKIASVATEVVKNQMDVAEPVKFVERSKIRCFDQKLMIRSIFFYCKKLTIFIFFFSGFACLNFYFLLTFFY